MGGIVSKVKVLRIAVKQVLELSASYERLVKRLQVDPGLPVPNPTKPFWHDILSPIDSLTATTLPVYADVVIIGSGITGTSVARTLLTEGSDNLQIIMLEARTVCSGATGRNGGHIKPPLHHEYVMLREKFGSEQAAKIIRFRQMHINEMLIAANEEGITDECQCREVDSLDVYYAPADFLEAKQQLEAWKQAMPKESEYYDAIEGEVAVKKFHLSSDVAGVIYNAAGAVHPYRFVTKILSSLLDDYAGRFVLSSQTPCTSIQTPTSPSVPLYRVVTPRGIILTPHIVHATNAWCSHLLPPMRAKIIGVRGTMTAQRPGAALSPASLDGGRSWVFYDRHRGYDYLTQLPDSEHELMLGGGFVQSGEEGLHEMGCFDDSVVNSGIAAHLTGVMPLLFGPSNWGKETLPQSSIGDNVRVENGRAHWQDGRMKAMWSGILGISADRVPWVGRIPPKLTGRRVPRTTKKKNHFNSEKTMILVNTLAPAGEWISAGYSGEGMAHAFLCGRALAMQILDRAGEIQSWMPECLAITEARWKKAKAEDLVDELWG